MAEQFANNASSTLNGAINNSTTTIVVTSATPFPTVGNFRLLIGTNPSTAEIVLVTGVSGTTFTVLRGQENTTASSWPDLTTVTHILTAGAVEQIRTQFVTVGNELYTTKTVSIDPNATVASSHGDGYSKLFVNGNILATKFAAGEIPLTTQSFNYVSDSLQSFTVPTGVTLIKVKVWGPGGGTGNYSSAGGGGAGGYSTGFLTVTPGETLYLAVGSGGKKPTSTNPGPGGLGGWPGGGFGTAGDASGGGGGGLTGIFSANSLTQANALIIAGGGGGATGFGNFGAGGGGGTTGGSGTSTSGKGATQSAGGLNGNSASGSTTIAAGSNGVSFVVTTIASGSNGASLPQGTINVVSTTGFSTSGTIAILSSSGIQTITYTGTNATQFTGCTGGTGTLSTGNNVSSPTTINVVSTTGFPSNNVLLVTTSTGTQIVGYTGTTATTFTGCLASSAGTMSTGGAVILASAGSALTGGIAYYNRTSFQPTSNDDGGGGSGYFGGGAGQGDGTSGGGGSGFLHATRILSGSTTAGANNPGGTTSASPPATTDVNYSAGIGVGAAATGASGNDGGNGYVVLQWGGITTIDLDSIDFGNTASISTLDTNITISSAPAGTITLAPGSGTLTLQSTSDFILSSGTQSLVVNANSTQKFKMYSSGAVIIGGADAQNDTSAEAQAGLTGPLINLSSSTGTISSTTNQATIFNQSGNIHIQGQADVRFLSGTSTVGYFDSTITGANIPLRLGQNASSTVTQVGNAIPNNAYVIYGNGASAWGALISNASANRSAFEVINSANGTNAGSGLSIQAAGPTHSFTEFRNNGAILQYGSSTSCLLFSKTLMDATGRATTGRVWQTGAWCIGDAIQNDTSSEAQAGLTGSLLNISQTTGGVLTTVANQALLYNVAGAVTLQGNTGHNFVAGTTSIASTSTSKFITSVGRRIATNVKTANYLVTTSDEVIIVGALSAGITITLPSSPTAGDTYTVKDQGGTSASFNIIIAGNGNNIDGVSSYTMNTNYESVTVVFANGSWSII